MARDNGTGSDLLYAEIDALQSETILQLRQRWKVLYGTQPPPRASRDLLTRAVAYRIQERALGGLSASTRRLLERIADSVQRTGRRGSHHSAKNFSAGRHPVAQLGRCSASGNGAAKQGAISRQAISLTVPSRAPHHR